MRISHMALINISEEIFSVVLKFTLLLALFWRLKTVISFCVQIIPKILIIKLLFRATQRHNSNSYTLKVQFVKMSNSEDYNLNDFLFFSFTPHF